ncbi:hypothetical protein MPC1_1470005 [Methylocella tundrae]|nr:hypothetical protein MPC1_1470005 [Methylocella tundrae]
MRGPQSVRTKINVNSMTWRALFWRKVALLAKSSTYNPQVQIRDPTPAITLPRRNMAGK